MTNENENETAPRSFEEIIEHPDTVLDAVSKKLRLKNDAALSRALGVAPPVISKIRHRKLAIGASMIVRILEITNWTVRDLHKLSTGACYGSVAVPLNKHRHLIVMASGVDMQGNATN